MGIWTCWDNGGGSRTVDAVAVLPTVWCRSETHAVDGTVGQGGVPESFERICIWAREAVQEDSLGVSRRSCEFTLRSRPSVEPKRLSVCHCPSLFHHPEAVRSGHRCRTVLCKTWGIHSLRVFIP